VQSRPVTGTLRQTCSRAVSHSSSPRTTVLLRFRLPRIVSALVGGKARAVSGERFAR
jgi:ABC-type enterobactin transport system permease subunit